MNKATIRSYIAIGISAFVYLVLGYMVPRQEYGQQLLLYTIAFVAYIYIAQQKANVWIGIGAAIGFRLLLLFVVPSPTSGYTTFGWSLSYADNRILLLRVLWMVCEAGTLVLLLRLLRKMGLPDKNVLLYALNPLVLLELTLHLHLSAWPILFLTLTLYFLYYQRHLVAGAAFGLAASVVSVPLLFLPLVLRRTGLPHFFVFLAASALVLLLLFYSGNVQADMGHLMLSPNNLAHTFNASFYHALGWLSLLLRSEAGVAVPGFVLISMVAAISVGLAIFKKQNSVRRLAGYMATVLTVYLLLSPAVYPWQLAPLLALTCLSHFRFAIVWSALIFLTYSPGFQNHETALALLEYISVLLWLIVELYFYRQRRIQVNIQKQ